MTEITPDPRPIIEIDVTPFEITEKYSAVLGNTTIENIDVYLPLASFYPKEATIFKNIGQNLLKVYPKEGELIDDLPYYKELSPLESIKLYSDDIKWWII